MREGMGNAIAQVWIIGIEYPDFLPEISDVIGQCDSEP